MLYVCCCRVLGAMANASPDLDNAEAQRQLNNNNRQIGSGFWETEVTSSKLFECSRIKALAGQRSTTPTSQTSTPHYINVLDKLVSADDINSKVWRTLYFPHPSVADSCAFGQTNEMRCRRRPSPSGLTPTSPECPVAYLTSTTTWGMDTCSPGCWRSSAASCWWEHPLKRSS